MPDTTPGRADTAVGDAAPAALPGKRIMNPEPVLEPTLGDVARRYPGWRCWQGVSGRFYAALPGSSPPVVVRGKDPADLRSEIRRAEADLP